MHRSFLISFPKFALVQNFSQDVHHLFLACSQIVYSLTAVITTLCDQQSSARSEETNQPNNAAVFCCHLKQTNFSDHRTAAPKLFCLM